MSIFSENRVDFDASNVDLKNSLFENSDITLLEAPLQLCENELSMFNFMIECDFIEANNNNIMTEAEAAETNEENKKSKLKVIKDKIVNAITFVIEAIKKAVSKFIDKILELFKADNTLLKKYASRLTMENLANFPGVENVESVERLIELNNKSIQNMQIYYDNFDIIDNAINARDFDTLKGTKRKVESLLNKLDKNASNLENNGNSIKEEKVWKISDKGLSIIKNAFLTTKSYNEIQKSSKKLIAGLEKHKSRVEKEFKDSGNDKVANVFYQLNMKYVNAISHTVNESLNISTRLYKAERKILLTLIKYLNNGQKKETTTSEAASYKALGEMSDLYIESVLCEY